MPKKTSKTSSFGTGTSRPSTRTPRPSTRTPKGSKVVKSKTKGIGKDKGGSFTERNVSQKALSHWKPIGKTSQAMLVQTIDTAIVAVLSQTSSVAYADVQDVLNSLKRRILEQSKNLTAPLTRRPKFGTLEAACHKLERDRVEAFKFEDQLSEKIEELTSSVEEKEKILEELEKNAMDSETSGKDDQTGVHYLLQETYESKLGIPPIRKTRSQTKKFAAQNYEPVPGVENLLQALGEREGLTSVKDYMTQLSDFVTLLPKDLKK